ncbi:MAG: DNA helicase-2/ATP-dependent DNA helicase PcrA [Bradymonadia bacterium]|jgi:DNA helicase-2/ATP-dependent DNA helicase PcrA
MRTYSLKVERPAGRVGLLDDLNPEQRAVAEATDGPILVVAGAGTGKTRTLTYRAAHLMRSGIMPECIMLLTFTNRAAREMLDRVAKLVPESIGRIWAGTFHGIAARLLREHAERLGYGQNFGILDSQEACDLMDLSIGEVVIDATKSRFPKAKVLLRMLSSATNTERRLDDVIVHDHPMFHRHVEQIDRVLTEYIAQKLSMNVMDYDDLLVNWRMLLDDQPELKAALGQRFTHLLVDEYQDTNRLQAAIVEGMSGPARNVMVVGDDCQSIYAFRGANVSHFMEFCDRFEGARGVKARIFKLQTNYRSTPQILAIANTSIKHNTKQFEKTLTAVREGGEVPAYVSLRDAQQQAAFVAQRVLELRDEDVPLSSQAVLYRAHYQAMELQIELQRRGIPFSIRSGMKFFEQAHVRDVLAHLKVLFNPLDRLAWSRVLRLQDGIGKTSVTRIFHALAQTGNPWQALVDGVPINDLTRRARPGFDRVRTLLLDLGRPAMLQRPGDMLEHVLETFYQGHLERTHDNAEQRVEDIRQMAHFASQYPDYQGFLEELSLTEVAIEDLVKGGESDEKLLLSTVHQAKGLEWDAVFVLHLADGQFPLARSLNTTEGLEEERRLFYVACTRPRRLLHLCHPQWVMGRERRRVMLRPSRFLAELPHTRTDLLETWRISES